MAAADIQPGTRLRADLLQLADWPARQPAAWRPRHAGGARRQGHASGAGARRTGAGSAGSRRAGRQGGLSALVAQGRRAMTVRVNDVVGVAGFALPGNYVDILVSTQEERRAAPAERELSISKVVLERILVLAVAQEASPGDTRPRVVNAVTLEVTPDEAETAGPGAQRRPAVAGAAQPGGPGAGAHQRRDQALAAAGGGAGPGYTCCSPAAPASLRCHGRRAPRRRPNARRC